MKARSSALPVATVNPLRPDHMNPISARLALSPARRLAAAAVGLAVVAILGACGEGSGSTCATCDTGRPVVTLSETSTTDSSIAISTHASDNLGLLTVHTRVSAAGISGGFDTTFNSAVTSVDIPSTIQIPSSVPIGTPITVIATAMDGAHNAAHPDTLVLHSGGGAAAAVILTNPHSTDTAVVGFTLAIAVSGKAPAKVKSLGYIASGVFATPVRDSMIFSSPLLDSIALDTALSLVGASTGTLTITPFMIDSLGRQTLGAPVSLFVTNVVPTNTIPVVDFQIASRIEARDTIHVEARDRSGITWIGYEVRNLPSGTLFFSADSVAVPANTSSTTHTFKMNLPVTTFPTSLQVQAFARNANTRDYARKPVGNAGVIRTDTVVVVAGLTTPLAAGGLVADALYHAPTNSIYLSNIERNELDVFNLGDSTFHTPIQVGSRPWGLAAWPRDRDGTMGDTLLVANSGGTLISYVNTNTQREVYRYPLPILLAQTVTSTTGSNGVLTETITDYVFSDRPQYLASTCAGSLVPGSPCGNVVLVYTTTPTAGQSVPFVNDGTVRWENLQTHESHFFFEQAMGQSADTKDTLQIQRFAAQGVGLTKTIVPFRQGPFVTGTDTSFYSIVIKIPALGFRDTTYARNSGNFRRAVLGEGGAAGGTGSQPNSRAILYDVTQGLVTTFSDKGHTYGLPIGDIDAGVSGSFLVTDFIANTSTPVTGVAINFDGELAGVRADSTYLFDNTLRLQGMLQTSAGNAGIDFHPSNAGIPLPGPTGGTHLFFAASNQPQVEVYNTNFYARCLVVPTRDPVIGPIKSAPTGGGNIVLVGATAHGVVILRVTAAQLTACS
ncbi:MAG: hypothetical protein JWO39_654 [Gemmatimonadetes bacterium]|nr:hypothetical protein [Gemmatimonadota bacterium]